ncbi:uncharacterized protein MONBRDRAFT_33512 [Monosiga brevicollis MX1]|uniref:DNA topoisomerase I n=1 Tax=Monosiga brevicollis TaxID=81824 RepID=A9V5T5_MONBE|nr:uncharacterized protein MONBRDRAFT_33512 [Monosiga brevicollis MX1]EDQ87099.1 predicted protein [Monosiga brevicollis MX1]|eukprot:XP_001748042.1 hypothetical protein [Monosiga brevicollis MX1]
MVPVATVLTLLALWAAALPVRADEKYCLLTSPNTTYGLNPDACEECPENATTEPKGEFRECVCGKFENATNNEAEECRQTVSFCAAGQYEHEAPTVSTDRVCSECLNGTYQAASNDAIGACSNWTLCLPGQFVSRPGSTSQDRVCEQCPANEYQSDYNAEHCKSCPKGFNSTVGAEACKGKPGVYFLNFSTVDASNNAAWLVVTVKITDPIKPRLELLGDNPWVQEAAVTGIQDPGAAVKDSSESNLKDDWSSNFTAINLLQPGNYSVTYKQTGSDRQGLSADPVTRLVMLRDTIAPTIKLAPNVNRPDRQWRDTAQDIIFLQATFPFDEPGYSAFDAVNGWLNSTVTVTNPIQSCNLLQKCAINYTVPDAARNVGHARRLISIVDTLPPNINMHGPSVVALEAGAVYDDLGATAHDLLKGNVAVDSSPKIIKAPDPDTPLPFNVTQTYSATDDYDNVATVQRVVQVVDTTAPTIKLNAMRTLEAGHDYVLPFGDWINVTDNYLFNVHERVIDNVSHAPRMHIITPLEVTVLIECTDNNGNTARSLTTVTLVDTTPPVITAPDIFLEGGTATEAPYPNISAIDLVDGDLTANLETTLVAANISSEPAPHVCGIGASRQTDPASRAFQAARCFSSAAAVVSTAPAGSVFLLRHHSQDAVGNVRLQTRRVTIRDQLPPRLDIKGSLATTVEYQTTGTLLFADAGTNATDALDGDIASWVCVSVERYRPSGMSMPGSGGQTDTSEEPATLTEVVLTRGQLNEVAPHNWSDFSIGERGQPLATGGLVMLLRNATPGTLYVVIYSVQDGAGHQASASRQYLVVDTVAPTLRLLGGAKVHIPFGTEYRELGVTAMDTSEHLLRVRVVEVNVINVRRAASYVLEYVARDRYNNTARIQRTVVVDDFVLPNLEEQVELRVRSSRPPSLLDANEVERNLQAFLQPLGFVSLLTLRLASDTEVQYNQLPSVRAAVATAVGDAGLESAPGARHLLAEYSLVINCAVRSNATLAYMPAAAVLAAVGEDESAWSGALGTGSLEVQSARDASADKAPQSVSTGLVVGICVTMVCVVAAMLVVMRRRQRQSVGHQFNGKASEPSTQGMAMIDVDGMYTTALEPSSGRTSMGSGRAGMVAALASYNAGESSAMHETTLDGETYDNPRSHRPAQQQTISSMYAVPDDPSMTSTFAFETYDTPNAMEDAISNPVLYDQPNASDAGVYVPDTYDQPNASDAGVYVPDTYDQPNASNAGVYAPDTYDQPNASGAGVYVPDTYDQPNATSSLTPETYDGVDVKPQEEAEAVDSSDTPPVARQAVGSSEEHFAGFGNDQVDPSLADEPAPTARLAKVEKSVGALPPRTLKVPAAPAPGAHFEEAPAPAATSAKSAEAVRGRAISIGSSAPAQVESAKNNQAGPRALRSHSIGISSREGLQEKAVPLAGARRQDGGAVGMTGGSLLAEARLHPMYHDHCSRESAEAALGHLDDGSFILRYSENTATVVLTVRRRNTFAHHKLRVLPEGTACINDTAVGRFDDLNELLMVFSEPNGYIEGVLRMSLEHTRPGVGASGVAKSVLGGKPDLRSGSTLLDQPWFHGGIGRQESEARLRDFGEEGAFLVRRKGPSSFAISVLTDGKLVHHLLRLRGDVVQFNDLVVPGVSTIEAAIARLCQDGAAVLVHRLCTPCPEPDTMASVVPPPQRYIMPAEEENGKAVKEEVQDGPDAVSTSGRPKRRASQRASFREAVVDDDDEDFEVDVSLESLSHQTCATARTKRHPSLSMSANAVPECLPSITSHCDCPQEKPKKPAKKAAAKKSPAKGKKAAQPAAKRGKAAAPNGKAAKRNGKAIKTEPEAGENKPKRKKAKKEPEEEEEIHRWWEEEELPDGQKWRTLTHRGPLFPPAYEPLPKGVHLLYDGKPYLLKPEAEEIAGFYAMMLTRDYVHKDIFNENFMHDWRANMTPQERKDLTDIKKCDFSLIHSHYQQRAEARKAASKEEKEKRKEAEAKLKEEYGFALMDGRKVTIGNFRIEPPGLFQGRGEHPKMGKLKLRVMPEDVIINVGPKDKVPEPPAGHKWKEVKHDNTVTWLAGWKENIQDQNKYIMLSADTHIKGRNDWKKYETARKLKEHVDKIRRDYTRDLKSKLMFERQRATALYFIDKLALRAGGEKDAEEQADTVGCCSLRVEHLELLPGDELVFDFLGKDSIRYQNQVKVDHQVWKNVGHFKKSKEPGDELFDRLRTQQLNEYLQSLMDGLTAKVFRTYNASITLQDQLKSTPAGGTVEEKLLAYQRANRAVAILCNHQRAAPKTHDEQMERLDEALVKIQKELDSTIKERKKLKKDLRAQGSDVSKTDLNRLDVLKRKVDRLEERLHKKQIAKVDKEENKCIALSTSKLNYLDPRISVAWCKTHDVPVDKAKRSKATAQSPAKSPKKVEEQAEEQVVEKPLVEDKTQAEEEPQVESVETTEGAPVVKRHKIMVLDALTNEQAQGRGRPKSGRIWKAVKSERFSANHKSISGTAWAKKAAERQKQKLLDAQEKEMKEETKRQQQERGARLKAKREQKEANRLKNMRLQQGGQGPVSAAKLRRMSKKQHRAAQKKQ